MPQPTRQKASLKTAIPGPKSKALRVREEKHLAPGLQNLALMAGIVVDRAEGNTVTDVDGNVFLDIIGGIGVNGLGHSHPTFVKALQEQVAKCSVGSFTSEARIELFDRLAEKPPAPGVHRVQLYSSGAEAVESALRLAKCYTGKHEFVSFWGGFHGKTMGALALMGSTWKKQLGPMVPGNHTVPYANPYRLPPGMTEKNLTANCIQYAREQLKNNSTGDIAAFIVEPMQGTNGNVIPPDDFLPAIKELAKEFGALLIVDEMITGVGRTGKQWGSYHSGVHADIVTLGKQFGGGFPMAAIMTTDEISQAKPWGDPSGSSSSYGGNALASAAGAAALRIIDEERLVENSAKVGAHFLNRLKPFVEKYSFVGDVRGRGLFLSVDMVKDKSTKEPMGKKACTRLFFECVNRGLLTMAYAPAFRIQPAMTIDEGTVDNVVQILTDAFDVLEAEKAWRD